MKKTITFEMPEPELVRKRFLKALKEYDFDKTIKIMKAVEHTWYFEKEFRIPNKNDIKLTFHELFAGIMDEFQQNYEPINVSSGGMNISIRLWGIELTYTPVSNYENY